MLGAIEKYYSTNPSESDTVILGPISRFDWNLMRDLKVRLKAAKVAEEPDYHEVDRLSEALLKLTRKLWEKYDGTTERRTNRKPLGGKSVA